MKRNRFGFFIYALVVCVGLSGFLFAARLVEDAEAINTIIPEKDTIEHDIVKLTPAVIAKINKRAGYEKFTEANKELDFIVGKKDGKVIAVAVIDSEQGKWGQIDFMIAIDPATSKVKDLVVLAFEEKRGRPIARRKFLEQFIGKSASDPLEVNVNFEGITGATISSKAASQAILDTFVVYEEVYKKK